jgi:hypothetical protein
MRSVPLIERGMRREKHEFPKNGRDIFSRWELDSPNQLEIARKKGFSARTSGAGAELLACAMIAVAHKMKSPDATLMIPVN